MGFDAALNIDGEENVKEAFNPVGKLGGFRFKLSGTTPGRLRVQFVMNEPQTDMQPLLAAYINTSMIYRLEWAIVPPEWDTPEAGNTVTDALYGVQLFVEGDVAAGPFDVCIDEIEPLAPDALDYEAQPAEAGYYGWKTVKDDILEQEYKIWKNLRFADCGNGSACIPRDEGDCISEGIGYGMLITVGFDDKEAFDKLWAYYKNHKNGAGLMAWQTAKCGQTQDSGAATDGDIDVAMALIQAACKWGGGTYEADAKGVISTIETAAVAQGCGTVIKPGDGFGGCDRTNPSYYSPGYFKAFKKYSNNPQTWDALINDGYTMIAANQQNANPANGLLSDWCNSSGSPITSISGDAVKFGPDASRVPWRMAIDYMWNNEDRAVQILDKFAAYVETQGGVARAFTTNSNFRGGSALAGMQKDATTAQAYTDAWLESVVDDETYFPGTLRLVYMLLAANKFPNGC